MDDEKIIDLFWQRDEAAITETDRKYSQACAEFDRIVYDKTIRFHDGYGGQITSVTETIKITAASLDKEHKRSGQDVYIVAKDFSWTYVKTHENGWYGPYFCYRIPEIWAVRKDKK